MKTIEQGAKEYANKTYPKIGLHEDWVDDGYDEGYNDAKSRLSLDDFKQGVEFAQRWIPIEEELPEDSDNLTQTEKYTYTENPVLVRTINGKYTVSKRSKFKQNENSKWEWMGSSSFSDSVTHWRQIELK